MADILKNSCQNLLIKTGSQSLMIDLGKSSNLITPPTNFSATILAVEGWDRKWENTNQRWYRHIFDRKWEKVAGAQLETLFQTSSLDRLYCSWRTLGLLNTFLANKIVQPTFWMSVKPHMTTYSCFVDLGLFSCFLLSSSSFVVVNIIVIKNLYDC
jgi:hypothetical protein